MPYDKTVFILGAGFSKPAGAPLIWDFFRRLRDLYDDPNSPLDARERERYGSVLSFRRELQRINTYCTTDLDNIEELFSLADIAVEFGGAKPDIRSNLVFAILRTLELSIRWPDFKAWEFEPIGLGGVSGPLYEAILRGLPLRKVSPNWWRPRERRSINIWSYDVFAYAIASRLGPAGDPLDSIISFNYDLLMDYALMGVGVYPDYCVEGFRLPSIPPDATSIPLLKLHGSANWYKCNSCKDAPYSAMLPVRDDFNYPVGANEHANRAISRSCEFCHTGGDGVIEHVIVPPSWNKGVHHSYISAVWQRALSELAGAHRIVIIGYSWTRTDHYFQSFFSYALSAADAVDVVVVDVVEEELAMERLRPFLRPEFLSRHVRYVQVTQPATQFVPTLDLEDFSRLLRRPLSG